MKMALHYLWMIQLLCNVKIIKKFAVNVKHTKHFHDSHIQKADISNVFDTRLYCNPISNSLCHIGQNTLETYCNVPAIPITNISFFTGSDTESPAETSGNLVFNEINFDMDEPQIPSSSLSDVTNEINLDIDQSEIPSSSLGNAPDDIILNNFLRSDLGKMCDETAEMLNMDVAVSTYNYQHVTEIAAKIHNLVEELKPLAATLNNQNFAS